MLEPSTFGNYIEETPTSQREAGSINSGIDMPGISANNSVGEDDTTEDEASQVSNEMKKELRLGLSGCSIVHSTRSEALD